MDDDDDYYKWNEMMEAVCVYFEGTKWGEENQVENNEKKPNII